MGRIRIRAAYGGREWSAVARSVAYHPGHSVNKQ
jgi:hypothetical protein